MRIYVIRHGISESNKSMTYSEPETRLAPEAARQLRSVKKKLKSVPFERVYASDYARTLKTAKILGFYNPILEPRVRERNFGIFTGHTRLECQEKFPEVYANYLADPMGYRIPEGESFDDLCDRVWDFLDELTEQERKGNPPIEGFRLRPVYDSQVLIVSHFNVIAACVCWVFGDRSLSPHVVADNGASLLMDVRGSLKTIFIER